MVFYVTFYCYIVLHYVILYKQKPTFHITFPATV